MLFKRYHPLLQTTSLIKTGKTKYRVIFIPDARTAYTDWKHSKNTGVTPPQERAEYCWIKMSRETAQWFRALLPQHVMPESAAMGLKHEPKKKLKEGEMEVYMSEWVSTAFRSPRHLD